MELYQAELNFDVVKDEHHTITQYVGSVSDISERKRKEAELKSSSQFRYLNRLAQPCSVFPPI